MENIGESGIVLMLDRALGSGKNTSGKNYSYHCPFCNHRKPKLEINVASHHYHCWVCNIKGRSLVRLLQRIGTPENQIAELKLLVGYQSDFNVEEKPPVQLPAEYQPLHNADRKNVVVRQALAYLKSRKITNIDILRYQLGFCESGPYANMIILPSYDGGGMLNYFVARNFRGGNYKYKNPQVSKDIIPMELFINWASPIILCEGMFDAIAIKRNAIPLLGKTIPQKLVKRIVSSDVKQVFVALDDDARKDALRYCETLLSHGKEVFMVNLNSKDPSELGFNEFTSLLHTSEPLTFKDLLELKISV